MDPLSRIIADKALRVFNNTVRGTDQNGSTHVSSAAEDPFRSAPTCSVEIRERGDSWFVVWRVPSKRWNRTSTECAASLKMQSFATRVHVTYSADIVTHGASGRETTK